MRPPFCEQLALSWQRSDGFLCVGLDPSVDRLPAHLKQGDRPIFEFCRRIVDATADLVCAFKPQIAFFAAVGAEAELESLIRYIHEAHPAVPVILDAKRGDVPSTAEQYALEAFRRYDADAVTVNPYLGWDGVAPFLAHAGRGVVVLCHTSNPDSASIQEFPETDPMYLRVARMARDAGDPNVMLVVGATYPDQLGRVRAVAGDLPLLVPGVGAQGGSAAEVVALGRDSRGTGLVVNASRSVLYAGRGEDFADAARAHAAELRETLRISPRD